MNLDSQYSFKSVGASIVVSARVEEVYTHWVHVEEFPHFMGAVREIRNMEDNRFYWRVERHGKEYESELQIVLRIPNRRMAWRTISGAESSGVVGFDPLAGDKTRVSFKMKYVPGAGWEDAEELLKRVTARLENFKTYVESISALKSEARK
ncbi:cyclase/dehydrase [Chthoniobacter flavus Ellin428]|uniref:Cyclase/dehydrase n=1 Tax=Chthoniobacter flavus Ellin428 TaxID=497964 RepID=B4CZQ1_9BACT|nr:SRPBCC family protein [Chthoniobacter flavus]EDY20215.1 cyclase/dehydrase [Chthoniobacter flavus Ellin428]TCO94112.1 polyketide cyclase/dehydrase/lipid transport protein [Chthoniobacter flavus]